MRRHWGVLGLVLVAAVALPVRPADAALAIVTDWRSPAADATVSGAVHVDLDVAFELRNVYRVRRWRVRLVDGSDSTLLCNKSLSPSQEEATVSFTWDSRYEPSGECADGVASVNAARLANGVYTLELTVWEQVTNGDGNAGTATRSIVVDNAPATPAGVHAEFDAAVQSVALSWQANEEPDLTGYRVEQCHTAGLGDSCEGLWAQVATPAPTESATTVAVGVPGAYRYRVQAVRSSGAGAGERTSAWADADEGIYLAPSGDGATPTTGPGGDGDGGCRRDCSAGTGGSDDDPTPGGTTGGDGSGSTGGPVVVGGSSSSGGAEHRRSLPPRLVRRADVEESYKEALPYGEGLPGDEGEGPLALVTDSGAGMALVPVAGGALAIVFALQMRYLSRRSALYLEGVE